MNSRNYNLEGRKVKRKEGRQIFQFNKIILTYSKLDLDIKKINFIFYFDSHYGLLIHGIKVTDLGISN